ncbi:hypothetical protein WN51_12737, partial [Melipona quadrifasciata]
GHLNVSSQEASSSKLKGQYSSAVTLSKSPMSALGLNGSSDTKMPSSGSFSSQECIFIGRYQCDGLVFTGATCQPCLVARPRRGIVLCSIDRARCSLRSFEDLSRWLRRRVGQRGIALIGRAALHVRSHSRILSILLLQVAAELIPKVAVDHFPHAGAVPGEYTDEEQATNDQPQHG